RPRLERLYREMPPAPFGPEFIRDRFPLPPLGGKPKKNLENGLDSRCRIAYSDACRHATHPKRFAIHNKERDDMGKVMTKSQVITHLAEKAGLQKKATGELLEELVALATKECKAGGQFVIPGLGKAVKAHRKARVGR